VISHSSDRTLDAACGGLSFCVSLVCDLRRPVVDSVFDGTARGVITGALPGWIVTGSGPGGALVAECAGEVAAEPGVLVGECLVALQGGAEPGAQ
jgi:hypothetical protein